MWFLNLVTFGYFKKKENELKKKELQLDETIKEAKNKIDTVLKSQRFVLIQPCNENDERYKSRLNEISESREYIYFTYTAEQEIMSKILASDLPRETIEQLTWMLKGIKYFNAKLIKAGDI